MIPEWTPPPLERLSTGDPSLDQILDGGIPKQSLTLLAGEPGAGKTVLALQMLFHTARQGKKALLLTTVAEPAIKLFRYMRRFEFFDQGVADEFIRFADLGEAIAKGREATLAEIGRHIEGFEPELVVIDSFRAIGDLFARELSIRPFLYELAVELSGWGATCILVGEYGVDEIRTLSEFAIADAIVRLGYEQRELASFRELEVLKLRGSPYISGKHYFEITAHGFTCYPRVRGPVDTGRRKRIAYSERISTGVEGLDELLHGGIPRASATIVQGSTGTGKTLLALQFLMEGARRGEPGVFFSLEESPDQLRAVMAELGWDAESAEAQGLLALHYVSPVEIPSDLFLEQARRKMRELKAQRAVIDGLTSLALGVSSERRFKELVYAISKHAAAAGTTLLLTMEIEAELGLRMVHAYGVSFAADNLVQLRFMEGNGSLKRSIIVLKARGIRHALETRELIIEDDGLHVGGSTHEQVMGHIQ
ncbi:MAG: ATPase domain-containing protein [Myxococcaceae bacterium]